MQNTLLWAVNQKYATDSTILQPEDTVACFPPVSGG
jgi:molybdopterin converting factor small subunit